jgi:natural product biosynthesis luciferase-like monooxygenase protein/amino acid adenylation domain-containing protein
MSNLIIDKPEAPGRRAKLSPEKQALLAERLRANKTNQTSQIMPRNAALLPPLSFVQESLWLQYQLDPQGIAYNLPAAIRLRGSLNVAALEWSVNAIIQRHETTRTNFKLVEGQAVQIIAPSLTITIPIIDLQALSQEEQLLQVQQLIAKESALQFDLSKDMLLRITLIHLSDLEHIVLFTTHHIISDGWSRIVFIQDLVKFYDLYLRGQPNAPTPLAIQYADFSVWQREQFNLGAFDQQLQYWKQQLSGAPFILDLPVDYPRSASRTFHGTKIVFGIPQSTTAALKALSHQSGTTLFMTLLAGFQTLLYRYTGQEDFLIGSPIANRQRREVEDLIGFFANTIVLRAQLSSDMRYIDLLQHVKQTALSAYSNQDIVFEKIVELVQPTRNASYSPLFQVMFAYQNQSIEEIQLPSLSLSLISEDSDAAKFDLNLSINENKHALEGKLEYNSDLFAPTTIERMINHFLVLLDGAAANPMQTIGKLPLLQQKEFQQLLDFSMVAGCSASPSTLCIHELFALQVNKTPHILAIVHGSTSLSYHQLNAQANQIAYHLHTLGAGPDTLIGICIERSAEMMIGLLGILKSGAAYVPLDPQYPTSRLAYMIQDSQIEIVLSQAELHSKLNSTTITILNIRDIIAKAGTDHQSNLDIKNNSNQLAYAIYTSGSTGKPKGVLVEHRNVTSFMYAMDKELGTTPGTWLAQTSISFDISVLELLWTVTRGYKVVIANSQMVFNQPRYAHQDKLIDFSLFYFASAENQSSGDKYKLLMDGARFADEHGFTAIWSPERHFATFGGLYPNPAITSAAIAAITKRISIRAGSCVLPLHNPIRVAEDWALVDNLSDGRIGLSFASGWQPNDFVLAPEKYADRNKIMIEGIAKVQALWRGEGIMFLNGLGEKVEVHTLPRPVQPQLPVWITASGNPETFRQAGKLGLNLLTHLLGQSITELAEKVQLYRQAWHEHGHGPDEGHVTLMLHTFIGEDEQTVLRHVKQPLKNYLRDSIGLLKPFADAMGHNLEQASTADMDAILEHAFSRYYKTSGLFGTAEHCQLFVDQLKGIGINEIACLIDFGIETETVMESLQHLQQLRQAVQPIAMEQNASTFIESIPELIKQHHITHFQCTPSLARVLLNDPATATALSSIHTCLIGGESLPLSLAHSFSQHSDVTLFNVYGPTECTIWSTLHRIVPNVDQVLIGKPLANTKIYILDQQRCMVPIGIAGEIYIGGHGVVRGYLHRTELTNERFVDCSIEEGKVERLYRTGDRGRYLPDGTIEHLGRLDLQVKIRGFRIELGEIEKVIAEFPEVREVIVTVQTQNKDTPYLVAYVIWETSEKLTQLRNYLKTELPEYMIPTFFVQLSTFPMTPNGKIDRNALPIADESDALPVQPYVPAQTALETIITELWTTTIGKAQIGIYDNFFELGGHSLLAAELAMKIQRAIGKRLPLHQFFDHPTIAEIAVYLEQSNDHLTEDLLLPTVIPDAANQHLPFPLTDVQQAYLIGRSGAFELGNISTHGYVELDFTEYHHEQLILAWNRLITRHAMLRMVITEDHQQKILDHVPDYIISMEDISHLSDEAKSHYLLACRDEMSHQVLATHQWPLFDLRVTKIATNSYRLHISLDTLIADGWSADILFQEFHELYTNKTLPAITLSFRDYVLAERKIKATNLYQRAREYWLDRIKALPFGPKLPLAKDPSQIEHPLFKRRQHIIDKDIWQILKRKAQKTGITPSVLLLTAYTETLGQWSKEPHFCLNLTLFHRLPLHAEVNQIIGDFTSLTLLEINLTKEQSFVERSHAIQKQLWNDLEHKYFSGVEVAREIARHHNSQRVATNPVVFTSTLDTDNEQAANPDNTDLQQLGKEVFVITQTPQVWLDHQVVERSGILHLTWDAVEELFPSAMLDDMFEAYCTLLVNLAKTEDSWQQPYRNLVPAYQDKQRKNINDNFAPQSSVLLHELFTHQARLQPNALAIITPTFRLTYGKLEAAAVAFAYELRHQGVQPNQLVAVVMEKGWEQVVAVLGILIAGGAYLPIDASLPQERINHLLEVGQVTIAITQPQYHSSLEWPVSFKTLIVETDSLPSSTLLPLPPTQTVDDLAYVIFTSGSTGKPKGVMINHRGAVNTVLDINQRYNVVSTDRVLALSSLSFDLSVYDIFGLLAAGGTIVFPNANLLKDPHHWIDLIQQENISLWNTVPMFLHMLVDHAENTNLPIPQTLRLALLSGDYIPITLPPRAQQLFSDMQVISLGGATEASIWSIYYPINEIDKSWKSIPYGKPLINQTMHVLQSNLMCSPVWVTGDIYIGGIGLAIGYWKDPEKTANSFIINPHTGERLYKTGDLGRYLPDGNIEFLGREDYQVKIQGHRVELGEIESIILQHEAIEQAVVVAASTDKTQSKRLAAYVVLSAHVMERYSETYRSKEMAFKLGQHGIRVGQPKQCAISLPSIPSDLPLTLTYFSDSNPKIRQEKSIDMHDLSMLLHCLRQIKSDEMLLPKYHYPSAGSLYPIQTYLQVKSNACSDISAGFYYYHPVTHALIFLSSIESPISSSPEHVVIYFVANMAAITPIYPDLADDFCQLEVGYMSQLLAAQASTQHIGLHPEINAAPEQLTTPLQLNQDHQLISAYRLDKQKLVMQNRNCPPQHPITNHHSISLPTITMTSSISRHYLQLQSFRNFSQSPLSLDELSFILSCVNTSGSNDCFTTHLAHTLHEWMLALKIYLHVQPDTVIGLETGGIYSYDIVNHALTSQNHAHVIDSTMHTPNNQSIFVEASFSLFLVLDKTILQTAVSNRALFLVMIGAIGQTLMHLAPEKLIGICPIGNMNQDALLSALQLDSNHELLHSFVGGKITTSQLQQLPQQSVDKKALSPTEILQRFLSDKLPQYMIPSAFFPLPALPQNANGKIDRSALPDVSVVEAQNNMIAPETATEKKIAEIWLELLNIPQLSVLDNFFELGGNSLLMLQMQRKIKTAFHTDLALVDLFLHTNVRALSQFLSGQNKINNTVKASTDRAQMRRNATRSKPNLKEKDHVL